jgi:hypothetical protein
MAGKTARIAYACATHFSARRNIIYRQYQHTQRQRQPKQKASIRQTGSMAAGKNKSAWREKISWRHRRNNVR